MRIRRKHSGCVGMMERKRSVCVSMIKRERSVFVGIKKRYGNAACDVNVTHSLRVLFLTAIACDGYSNVATNTIVPVFHTFFVYQY